MQKQTSLPAQIAGALFVGVLTGVQFGMSASWLGGIGAAVITLIKVLAVPLVFFVIVDALITTDISSRQAVRWFGVIAVNALAAVSIGLALTAWFEPGAGFPLSKTGELSGPLATTGAISFSEVISGFIPKSVLAPFVENNVLGVVVISLVFGAALRSMHRSGDDVSAIEMFCQLCIKALEKALSWVVRLVPLAIFAVTAKTVGEYGFAPFRNLAVYVGVVSAGLLLQPIIVYSFWLFVFARVGVRRFFGEARRPLTYAFGVNSSLATLPLTLHALDALGVSKASSRMGACVGTNFNNDGILLYEAIAVFFIAQAYGMSIPLGDQIGIAFLCVIAAMGVAGVPEAGVISLALVLGTLKMPTELLPLLLTVDWFIARLRSVVNVWSDLTVSIAIDSSVQTDGQTP